ncbi:MAG: DNA replication/repair protein RecF, partial [Pseudolysinimonas sp.]
MIVAHLSLSDFRNYETAEVGLLPGPNVFVGSNGQGKTNLVEAIGYLATLGSHRVSTDQALIRSGTESGIVRARLRHGDREVLLEVQLNRTGANRAQVNRVGVRPRELPRHIATVLFAPEDLALVRGEPSGRRRFLDQLLVQLSPRFAGVIADYERVLRQRNSLLKSARGHRVDDARLSTLDVWDERLVDLGTQLIDARADLVERLRPHVAVAYERIAGAAHVADLALELSILGAQPEDDDPAAALDSAKIATGSAGTADVFRTTLTRLRRSEL